MSTKKSHNVPKDIEIGQYQYDFVDCLLMITSPTECLAIELYKKLLWDKTWPFKVIQVSLTTLTID